MYIIIQLIIALAILAVVAFPERFLPPIDGQRRKRVGPTYWGSYQGSPAGEAEGTQTFETVSIKKKGKVIAGSSSYAVGRGVNASGSSSNNN